MDESVNEQEKIRDIQKIKEEDIQALNAFQERQLEGMAMYLSDQWRNIKKKRNKSYLSLNIIKKRIDMISGFLRRNRTDLKMSPIGGEDDRKADVYSQLLKFVFSNKAFWQTWCEAIDDMLVGGLGWAHPYIDFDSNVYSGELKCEHINSGNILFDPYLTKFDLSDCGHLIRHMYVDRKVASMKWPQFADEFLKISEVHENAFYSSMNRNFESKGRLNFVEFWYRDAIDKKYVFDTVTNQMQEFDGDEGETIQRLVALGHDVSNIAFIKKQKSVIKMTLVCEDTFIIYDGISPEIEDMYPFIPIVGWYLPSYTEWKDKLQGAAWVLHDVQKEKNKRRNQLNEFIFTKNIKGYAVNRSANADIQRFIEGETEYLLMDDINGFKEIEPPRFPEVYALLEKESNNDAAMIGPQVDLLEASGGQGAASPVGSLQIMQSQSLTQIQKLLDNVDTAYEALGNYTVKLINKYWGTDIIRKIVGDNIIGAEESQKLKAQMKQLMDAPPSEEKDAQIAAIGEQIRQLEDETEEFWKEFDQTRQDVRYDCVITESQPTPTHRLAMLQMFSTLLHQGVQIDPEVWIPYTELSPKEKERWIQIEREKKQMQMQMAQMQMQAQQQLESAKIQAGLAKQELLNAGQLAVARENKERSYEQ